MFKWGIFVLLVVLIALHLHKIRQHVPCRSDMDHRVYHVLATHGDRQEAAERLGFLVQSMQRFVRHLERRKEAHPEHRLMIERLAARYPPKVVREGRHGCHFVRQKEQELVICVRGSRECFMSLHKLRKVMIHELAHIASEGTGHGAEFQANNRFLLKQSKLYFLRQQ